ncbi:unnamed protein product [Rotaria sordida]|uniref:ARID domain-containing protein n=2 Tax=Rotaria sordida TaxID=392033 RepID=A0A818K6C9_9BILA|nr:unnamed protein product [Rotaria sordida]CAF1338946.1 unnamed protein product [Rotaria sordida]CAF3551206.1 unnamed protein product [Rotaria sordida]CAF3623747.1 unnamed protein product [Rotaria sordida]
MEILRAESNEFHHLKNNDGPTDSSPLSSTIDDDDDDHFSNVSTHDEKVQSTNTIKNENDDKTTNENKDSLNISPIINRSISTIDYTRHRERLAKELKDYEDRWLAHRNFLLYTQSFAMKPEDRERLFAQLNTTNSTTTTTNHNNNEENSPLHQLQIQQQLFHRLSKEERDRFLAVALYQQQQQQQQQQQNPYSFHSYPWTNPTTPSILSPTANIVSQIQSSSDHQQPKSPSSDDSGNQSNSGSTTEWTFEEQFRQLYELSDEPKRKEFLDDLFAFMQKRGTPVNRIPIMAKHVLDLYELFRLVVGKGGLVEVINKKLWREVTKGLNLPSSITSAAFTLRTQYMKYLYPYECEKLQLSSPSELQAAIEGNRREGRRPSYTFEYSSPPQIMPPPPPPTTTTAATANSFLASPLAHRPLDSNHAAMAAALSHPFFLAAAAAASSSSSRDVNETTSTTSRISSFDDHHHHLTSPSIIKRSISPSFLSKQNDDNAKKFVSTINNNLIHPNCFTPSTTNNSSLLSQVSKLNIIAKENNLQQQSNEKSIQLSIELNGIAYQGTLYATTCTGSKE